MSEPDQATTTTTTTNAGTSEPGELTTPALPYLSMSYGLGLVSLLAYSAWLIQQRRKLRQLGAALRS